MTDGGDNPFERYDIDPLRGPTAITVRMRQLAEAAPDEASRKQIRAAWEELTRHPARRFRAAVTAHPGGSEIESLSPPPAPRPPARTRAHALLDLALRPALRNAEPPELPDVSPAEDPFLR